MTRAALVLAMVSALCLGVSLGFMGGVVFSHHREMGFRRHDGRVFRVERQRVPGEPGPRGYPPPGMLLPHLERLLDLTPQQSDAILVEVEHSRGDFDRVRDSMHARIQRHLTSEQRQLWLRLVNEPHPGEPRGLRPRNLRAEPGREGDPTR